jgi:nucleoside-diphosphate-sugar epimerase
MTQELHVVLGAGQVGTLLMQELLKRGKRVRVVSRSPRDVPEGAEHMSGDITDVNFATSAMQGAAVVYQCTNPSQYHRWDVLLMPLHDSIREAAIRTKVKLVVLDCLYMLGHPQTAPMTEDHPMNPCSKKGALRKKVVEAYLSAAQRGDLQVTFGRASDFFGPGSGSMSAFGDHLGGALAKKRAVEVFGDPDMPHSYSYIPDVARGLAILGTEDGAFTRPVWNLPVSWNGTTRELLQKIGAELSIEVKARPVPDWMLAIMGVFMPMLGAIREMTYQWKAPYLLDDTRFVQQFGASATPANEAIAASAKDLQKRYMQRG